MMTELWGHLLGLEIAWEKGWQNIIFEMVSMVAMEMVCDGCADDHPCKPIIVVIQDLLKWSW